MPCNGKNNSMLSPHSLEPMPCNLLPVAWRTKAYLYPHGSSRRGTAAQPCSALRSKPAMWAVGEQLCSVLHRVDEGLEAPVGAWSTRCEMCIGSCYTSVWPDLQVYWLLLHFSLACSNSTLFDGVHKNWQANPMGRWKEAFVDSRTRSYCSRMSELHGSLTTAASPLCDSPLPSPLLAFPQRSAANGS